MAYSQDLKKEKSAFIAGTIASGTTTSEIDLEGGTLAGVLILADMTSTSFTITVSNQSGGTFVPVKDPEAAGASRTYTTGSTSTGYFPISPQITAGFRFCKIVFDSSETNKTIYIARRNMD